MATSTVRFSRRDGDLEQLAARRCFQRVLHPGGDGHGVAAGEPLWRGVAATNHSRSSPSWVAYGVSVAASARHDPATDEAIRRRADARVATFEILGPPRLAELLEHAVADARRLQHAIARGEDEIGALPLVDQADSADDAEDQLEADVVEVHLARHRCR